MFFSSQVGKTPAEPKIRNMICPLDDITYTLTNSRTGEYEVYFLLEEEDDDDDDDDNDE